MKQVGVLHDFVFDLHSELIILLYSLHLSMITKTVGITYATCGSVR